MIQTWPELAFLLTWIGAGISSIALVLKVRSADRLLPRVALGLGALALASVFSVGGLLLLLLYNEPRVCPL